MAKKPAARRKTAAPGIFDEKKFKSPRIQATFDYNELSLVRASNQLWQTGKNVALGVAMVSLVCIIVYILLAGGEGNLAPAIVLLAVSVVSSATVTRWDKVQLRRARTTSLGLEGEAERRRVTVTDDAVHMETSNGAEVSYPLSSLCKVFATEDSVTADFGKNRYVYVPRTALSENRFRELVRILKEARDANKGAAR